jgi:nucleotidyltransferase/DNA polymerase involved in DNA repair
VSAQKKPRLAPERKLSDLSGIGKAMLRDFDRLGIRSVDQLAKETDGHRLYDRICRLTGVIQDPCVLDTYCCAVAQARDPKLPREQRNWWWWSRKRKKESGSR